MLDTDLQMWDTLGLKALPLDRHHVMKAYGRLQVQLVIFNLRIIWSWAVSFTSLSLYPGGRSTGTLTNGRSARRLVSVLWHYSSKNHCLFVTKTKIHTHSNYLERCAYVLRWFSRYRD
jgi:hypothetical protein